MKNFFILAAICSTLSFSSFANSLEVARCVTDLFSGRVSSASIAFEICEKYSTEEVSEASLLYLGHGFRGSYNYTNSFEEALTIVTTYNPELIESAKLLFKGRGFGAVSYTRDFDQALRVAIKKGEYSSFRCKFLKDSENVYEGHELIAENGEGVDVLLVSLPATRGAFSMISNLKKCQSMKRR